MVRSHLALLLAAASLTGCASAGPGDAYRPGYAGGRDYRGQPLARGAGDHDRRGYAGAPFADIGFATWRNDEPEYRLYPGDTLDVSVLSAPELNRTVTVQPDGRITLPLIQPLMVADRSAPQVERDISQSYASQLVRPDISVAVKTTTPLKVFVGGMVDKPGVYDMPGDIDAMQAIIMAGGFKVGAKTHQVAIVRRGPGGQPMMRAADLGGAGAWGGYRSDQVAIRRFDIIYVPRTGLSEVGAFVTQVRDALPFQFSYVIGGQYVTSR